MKSCAAFLAVWALIAAFNLPASAQEHRVESLDEAAPSEGLNEEIAKQLQTKGLKVMRGSNRAICEIWLCKEWQVAAEAATSSQRLYPFQPGQLIGVIHFPRKSSDFRDQDIESGVYTLRYGLQPEDGNHVGTSPTRDFLVVVQAEKDKSAEPMAMDELQQASAESLGTAHPGILCLKKWPEAVEKSPAMIHDEANEWWLLHCESSLKAGSQTKKQALDLIVVGHAHE